MVLYGVYTLYVYIGELCAHFSTYTNDKCFGISLFVFFLLLFGSV